jgi:hypothetical protein
MNAFAMVREGMLPRTFHAAGRAFQGKNISGGSLPFSGRSPEILFNAVMHRDYPLLQRRRRDLDDQLRSRFGRLLTASR